MLIYVYVFVHFINFLITATLWYNKKNIAIQLQGSVAQDLYYVAFQF